MSGQGPRKTPTALALLKASSVKAQRLLKRETPTPGELIDAPEWFNEEQKAAWNYVIENAPRGFLRRIDKSALAVYIIAEDTHRRAATASRKLVIRQRGIQVQNPYLPIVANQAKLMLRAASELGFTPTARARIDSATPPVQELGDWSEEKTG